MEPMLFDIENHTMAVAGLQGRFEEEIKKVKDVFRSFDKDGNGTIDRDEIAAAIGDLGVKLDDKALEQMFLELDGNKDNKVSFDEFARWWFSGRQKYTNNMRRLLGARKAG